MPTVASPDALPADQREPIDHDAAELAGQRDMFAPPQRELFEVVQS